MNSQQILEEAEKDLLIDYSGDIGKQIADQPKLFIKWTKRLKEETKLLGALNLQLDSTSARLWVYYTGKADPDVYKQKPMHNRFLKSEAKDAIAADSEFKELKVKIMLKEELVDTLERIVGQIKDRGWSLKSVLEWKKFMSGD